MDKFKEFLPTVISIVALLASFLSIYLSFKNNQRFASNQFINKQIDVIAEFVKALHKDLFQVNFVPRFTLGSGFSLHSKVTLFEVPLIQATKDRSILDDLDNTPIYFHHNSNQIADLKSFIDDPYLPKSIANALLHFYTTGTNDIPIHELAGAKLIILATNYFELGSITGEVKNNAVLKQSNAKAFINWKELLFHIGQLETSIEKYLQSYKVAEINIRKDLKNIYVT